MSRRRIDVPSHVAGRRRLVALVTAALLIVPIAVLSPAVAQTCLLEPTVHSATVNQGTDDYSPLAWGHDTIFRPYLLLPSCASPGSISTTGGTLQVQVGGFTLPTLSPYSALPSPPPAITPCCTPASNNPADQMFLILGDTLKPPAGEDAPFPVTFAVTINYRTSTGTTGSVLHTVARAFGERTNPPRVLAVRLGNKSSSKEQFTATDNQTWQAAMERFADKMPVAEGLETLSATGSTAGVRWQYAPGLADIGALMTTQGKFCGNGSNFPTIKNLLESYKQAHNSNPANIAAGNLVDNVVGLVGESISVGSSTSGCNDGQAAAPGSVSWVRISSSPRITTAVWSQEFAHNGGILDAADPREFGWHSTQSVAETKHRAYNMTTRGWLAADRTVMNGGISGWDDESALFEAPDWSWIDCKLDGTSAATANCGGAGVVGAPASAHDVFQIRGTVDATTLEAKLLSNWTQGGLETPEATEGDYYVVYRGANPDNPNRPGSILEDGVLRLAVEFGSTDHHSHERETEIGTVDASLRFNSAAVWVQVVKGHPDLETSVALYEVKRTTRPVVTAIDVTPTEWEFNNNITASPGLNEVQPHLSLDGRFAAYVERQANGCAEIVVARVNNPANTARPPAGSPARGCGDEAPSEPAISPNNDAVAFIAGGDLWRIDLDAGDNTLTLGATIQVISCVGDVSACLAGLRAPISGDETAPGWSPDFTSPQNQWLVISVEGDLYRLFPFQTVEEVEVEGVGVARAERLTREGLATQPSVGPGAIVAFERTTERGPALWTLDAEADEPESTQAQVVCCGELPSFAGELITYEKVGGDGDGMIYFVNPDNPIPERITELTADTWPSLIPGFAKTMAIQREITEPNGTRQQDVLIGEAGSRRDITMTGIDDLESAGDSSGFIFLECGGTSVATAVDLQPEIRSRDEETNTAVVAYTADDHDTGFDCEDAPVAAQISDDYSISDLFRETPDETIVTGAKEPTAAWVSPFSGARLHNTSRIPLAAMAWDAEEMVLDDEQLKLFLTIPGESIPRYVLGTGGSREAAPQDVGLAGPLWPLGTYTARVEADDDGDGTPDAVATSLFRIIGPTLDLDFDPNTLYVPSSGNSVTVSVRRPLSQLSCISTGRIVDVQGHPYTQNALSYSVANGVGVLKFDRQRLSGFMADPDGNPATDDDLVGVHVSVGLEVYRNNSNPACSSFPEVIVAGWDPTAPVTRPSS